MPAALILAAGSSKRFGGDKRMHPLPDGRPILGATIARYAEVFNKVWVVTKKDDTEVQKLLDQTNVYCLTAADATLGMGHSLAAAARVIREQFDGALVVGLADMPYVQSTTLRKIAETLSEDQNSKNRVIQPRFNNQPGNPVGFGAALLAALTRCSGDEGARQIVARARRSNQLTFIDVEDHGVLHDIDTPAALELPRTN